MTADLDLGYDQEMVMYLNHETRLSGMMNPPVSVVVQQSSVTKNGMQEGSILFGRYSGTGDIPEQSRFCSCNVHRTGEREYCCLFPVYHGREE
jgi:hypothetical protein